MCMTHWMMGPTPRDGELWNQWISALPCSSTAQLVNSTPRISAGAGPSTVRAFLTSQVHQNVTSFSLFYPWHR